MILSYYFGAKHCFIINRISSLLLANTQLHSLLSCLSVSRYGEAKRSASACFLELYYIIFFTINFLTFPLFLLAFFFFSFNLTHSSKLSPYEASLLPTDFQPEVLFSSPFSLLLFMRGCEARKGDNIPDSLYRVFKCCCLFWGAGGGGGEGGGGRREGVVACFEEANNGNLGDLCRGNK